MRRPPALLRRWVCLSSLFWFLLLLLPLGTFASSVEIEALLQFKASVTSDPAGVLALWSESSGSGHCEWPGVSCDERSRVVALNISSQGGGGAGFASCSRSGPFWKRCPDPARRLGGKLSPAVGVLAELRVLSLPFNAFGGVIPGAIWELEKLEVVVLEANSFSGFLPSKFPPALRVLNLASNLIGGEIPVSLSSNADLETVDLSGNQLNGTIPGFLTSFVGLRELYLSFNQLGGTIPVELGSGCRNLQHLDLSGNLLVGSIPRSLGNCGELQSLILSANLLDDAIPLEFGRLRKLQVLDVSRNSLSGPVPVDLGGCLELSVLVLSNPYNPTILSEILSYADSEEFNYFQGKLAENITMLPKLRVLWAPKAMLEGEIPNSWGACKSLEMVNLGENIFTGGIPKAFGQCHNLKFLNLSSNKLSGLIYRDLPVPCMDIFDISGNFLSGSIPTFNLKSCPISHLPPDGLASGYSSFFFYRTKVRISLTIGHDITVFHNLCQNKFTGGLPSLPLLTDRLSQAVYSFLVNDNNISGPLDDVAFHKCNELKGAIIDLSNNWISGQLPSEIGSTFLSLVVLNVSGNQITGVIPQDIGLLTNVVRLDFSRNLFHGEIPPTFENLEHLQYLSLQKNNLTGSIPTGFAQLHDLEVLDLSSNCLYGEIPRSILSLKNLSILLLDNNNLSGKIPIGLASMPSLSMVNVSFNNLSGSLPNNASVLTCDSILGNPLIKYCPVKSLSITPSGWQGHSAQDSTDSSSASPSNNNNKTAFSNIEIASIASTAAIVSVLLTLIVVYIYTRKCAPRFAARSSRSREVTLFTDIGVPITFETVVRATGNFNASNCIGHGGFGATYKAEISPGVLVAIKRLSIGRFQGLQQFHAEIKTLGRLRHSNLVTLIGYHLSEEEMFLIYNYLSGGNLERFIQGRHKRAVDWRVLHKIALDIACALAYLHDHCVPRILHRDVKPSNILLDNECKAYLSDFGLARLLGNSETHATTGVAGTFGYVAPEYAMTCRVSDKADVYSYGVVLMELISDKKALDPSFSPYGNGFNIVAWACMLLREGRAREFFMEELWEIGPHDDLVETLHLAIMCTVDSLSTRPTMKQVVQRLKQLQPPTF
ncbi:LRR receptor-like serine/threonine-protein kinase RPK2 [Zingiber officinale]|uniref:non-specific serine/threonine protein kinase n=1 Tax=Zingiber officinale TaxID=94328 RepID=A0A8J5G5X9_ZINOF|nr:LRR receptor-like serine/threonine-protein kinase RPK2 [Zingiber officinale]KAG6498809.1 hypothetical protein ZIOFF_038558 [Zingiber officinale]